MEKTSVEASRKQDDKLLAIEMLFWKKITGTILTAKKSNEQVLTGINKSRELFKTINLKKPNYLTLNKT